MKKACILLALMFSFLLQIACNNDDDNTPINPIDQLPPATQIGANTAGCLVDGEAFLPNNESVLPVSCNYLDGEDFTLIVSKRVNGIYFIVSIYIYDTMLEVGGNYTLKEVADGSKFGEYSIDTDSYPSPNYYSTTEIVNGSLTITHHDFDNAILSGTFSFDAINSEGKIIKITEGRFDTKY